MAKIGRNQPCPCGSGKKYKVCCLQKDEATAKVVAAKVGPGFPNCITRAAPGSGLPDIEGDDIGLDDASNGVVDLIRTGKLDQAEQAARALLARYPGVVDGYDRLGMVFDARGTGSRRPTTTRRPSLSSSSTPGASTQKLSTDSASSQNSVRTPRNRPPADVLTEAVRVPG